MGGGLGMAGGLEGGSWVTVRSPCLLCLPRVPAQQPCPPQTQAGPRLGRQGGHGGSGELEPSGARLQVPPKVGLLAAMTRKWADIVLPAIAQGPAPFAPLRREVRPACPEAAGHG